ncbi:MULTISPECIES: hypothetical protein [Brevundimonas]|uniref:Uncharacterized protein n=1 Tax=Brevundimonas diminuta 3F5N TaxID=1255603 RepID=A0A1R4G053_BREDI|nr:MULTISPECIES: hypothetical protein [Brevundimonas]SJM61559.1 hypothetical protein FM111_08400 [Brevundimonas diminuta 3F5N]HBY42545.1 hypothetical protein [Brevundimonas sp.]
MKRTEQAILIASRIQRALKRAEDGQDQSIERLGGLAQALTRGRKDAGLSATVGQPAFDALARAMAAQVAAQAAMVELHEALADVKETTRFRGVQLVGLDKQDQPVPRNVRLSLIERVG